MNQKDLFINTVKEHFENWEEIIIQFEYYHKILLEKNKHLNLVSRKTTPEDYWTLHFLDSILVAKNIIFENKKVLDFGTGGGLPGIPLKLLFPSIKLDLLDSKKKKIKAIGEFLKKLDLKTCNSISARIEELDIDVWYNSYDIIVCRSVKILPKYKNILMKLLKKGGRLVLYKSRNLDDVSQFKHKKIYEFELEALGKRRIIEIIK